ncbi:MAG TPA: zinc ribbon domain-containing protein [Legionella sp.]|nr:zinc ribbon domain-containing protein [Legionella sp.]
MGLLKRIFNNYLSGHHGGYGNYSQSGHHGKRRDGYYSNNPVDTKTCPDCQAIIDAQARFCGQCGKDTNNMACRCGAFITPGAKYCGRCGSLT